MKSLFVAHTASETTVHSAAVDAETLGVLGQRGRDAVDHDGRGLARLSLSSAGAGAVEAPGNGRSAARCTRVWVCRPATLARHNAREPLGLVPQSERACLVVLAVDATRRRPATAAWLGALDQSTGTTRECALDQRFSDVHHVRDGSARRRSTSFAIAFSSRTTSEIGSTMGVVAIEGNR